jgi:hypothetical protein
VVTFLETRVKNLGKRDKKEGEQGRKGMEWKKAIEKEIFHGERVHASYTCGNFFGDYVE